MCVFQTPRQLLDNDVYFIYRVAPLWSRRLKLTSSDSWCVMVVAHDMWRMNKVLAFFWWQFVHEWPCGGKVLSLDKVWLVSAMQTVLRSLPSLVMLGCLGLNVHGIARDMHVCHVSVAISSQLW